VTTPGRTVFCEVRKRFSTSLSLLVSERGGELSVDKETLDSELGDREVNGLWNG
jgi:hypothetical protein